MSNVGEKDAIKLCKLFDRFRCITCCVTILFDLNHDSCRIGVDEYLRVPGYEDVYAIGDCAGYLESTGKQVLPALAQVR